MQIGHFPKIDGTKSDADGGSIKTGSSLECADNREGGDFSRPLVFWRRRDAISELFDGIK